VGILMVKVSASMSIYNTNIPVLPRGRRLTGTRTTSLATSSIVLDFPMPDDCTKDVHCA
jgi:hypothetical protein